MDFDGWLKDFERRSRLKAHEADEEADTLEEEHDKTPHRYGGPHADAAIEARQAHIRKKIDGKRTEAAVHRRRAEHADAGYLLHSPDESRDSLYMKEHQHGFMEATRRGRLRTSKERLTPLPWENR